MAKSHVSKKTLQKSYHLSGSGKGGGKGCVTKCYGELKPSGKRPTTKFDDDHHGNYRYHGYYETKSKPTKKAYYEPTAQRLKKFPIAREAPHGVGTSTTKGWRKPKDPSEPGGWGFNDVEWNGHKNYQDGNTPFAHDYHHMVPWEVLGSGLFTTEELKLLQKSEYCLHDGFNLIILPKRARVAEILRMHTHPNNHSDYNFNLEVIVLDVKGALCGADPDVHLTDKTAPVMKETFENWERNEWMKIMESGKQKYPDHVNEHTPSDMMPALIRSI